MRRVLIAFAFLVFAGPASAETPFQFAAPNHQSPKDPNVNGVRLSVLHGRNQSVRGLDFGLLSLSETQTLSGLGLVVGVGKVDKAMAGGAALALVNVHGGQDTGFNGAFVNRLNSAPRAVNVAFVNIADADTLLDLGGLNVSRESKVQLGFINVTNQIRYFQFGFINVAENGFLPVFPVFNFPKN